MSTAAPLIAAIEAGGTKFVCGIGTGPHDIKDVTRIDTTTPEETLGAVCRFLSTVKAKYGPFAAIGVGCFGPLDLNPSSATYGYITTTPKRGWPHTDVVSVLKDRYHVPVVLDTDVNAAVLGECLWGAGQGMDPVVYITVGTGVGGGVLVNGRLLHGAMHPEIGHLAVSPPVNSLAISRDCQCPFHKSCVEGYVSGVAISKRWGVKAESLPPDHPVWEEISDVMGHALMNLCLTLSPRRIILGGGVMEQPHLIPLIRAKLTQHLNGYLSIPELGRDIENFVVSPGLGARSGLLGALALGKMGLAANKKGKS